MDTIQKALSLISEDSNEFPGDSGLLREYLLLSSLKTLADRNLKSLKARIFAKPRVKKILDQSEKDVRLFLVSANVPIIKHKGLTGVVQINPGASYVDFDALRQALGVTESAFENAILAATKRRNPNFTLKIVQ